MGLTALKGGCENIQRIFSEGKKMEKSDMTSPFCASPKEFLPNKASTEFPSTRPQNNARICLNERKTSQSSRPALIMASTFVLVLMGE